MQSDFVEEYVKSEYSVHPSIFKLHDMPSYNPEQFAQDRLTNSIRETAQSKCSQIKEQPNTLRSLKYQSYYRMQAWLEHIGQDLQLHKQIIKDIFKALDKRSIASERSLMNVIEFLKSFITQEKQNITYLRNKNKELTKVFSDGDIQFYPKLSAAVNEINKYDLGNAERISNTLDGIDKYIREKLVLNKDMYNSGLASLRELYAKSFDQYATSYSKVNKYRRKYQSLFTKMMTQEISGKDLYYVERKLIKTFIESTKLQQGMGLAASKIWDEIIKQETVRQELIIASFRLYLDKQVTLTSSKQRLSAQEELIYSYLNDQQPINECQQSLLASNLLSQANIQQMLRMVGNNQTTISEQQVKYFLYDYPNVYLKIAMNENNTLIQHKIENAQVDCGTLLKAWKPCKLIITVDNHLLIFITDSDEFTGKYNLMQSQLIQKSRAPLIAELKQTKPGIIFDSNKSALLQLDAEEFDQFQKPIIMKYFYSQLRQQFTLKFAPNSNVNQLLAQLATITYQSNIMNHNIENLKNQDNYQQFLQLILNNKDNLTVLGLTKGIYSMRKISQQRRLTENEQLVKALLLGNTHILIEKDVPVTLIGEAYQNLVAMGVESDDIAGKLTTLIRNDLVEKSYLQILNALQDRILGESEQELIDKLNTVSTDAFNYEAKINIFKLYAQFQPLYKAPFYKYPSKMSALYKEIKVVPSQSMSNIFKSYSYLPDSYPQDLLQSVLGQFNQQVNSWKSNVDISKLKMLCHILESMANLNQDTVKIDWDQYFKAAVQQCVQLNCIYQSSLDQILSVYMLKINNNNAYLIEDLWNLIIKNDRFFKQPKLLDFLAINKQHLPEHVISALGAKLLQQKQQQKFKLPFIVPLKYFNVTEAYQEYQQQTTFNILKSMDQLNQSHLDNQYLILEHMSKIDLNVKTTQIHLRSIIFSINCKVTLEQFKDIFTKKMAELRNRVNFQQLLTQILCKQQLDYPKRYNPYQTEFIIWLMSTMSIKPIGCAPEFYNKLSTQSEQVVQFAEYLSKQVEEPQLGRIWQQMNCINNAELTTQLSRLGVNVNPKMN